MAMNNDNLNEMLEDFNRQEKKIKEVDEQLSSTDIQIEYYKEKIAAEMAERGKNLKMKQCKLQEKQRTAAELETLWRKVYSYNFFVLFFAMFILFYFPYLQLIIYLFIYL